MLADLLEPFQSERRAFTIAQQPFQTHAIMARNAYRSVKRESAHSEPRCGEL